MIGREGVLEKGMLDISEVRASARISHMYTCMYQHSALGEL